MFSIVACLRLGIVFVEMSIYLWKMRWFMNENFIITIVRLLGDCGMRVDWCLLWSCSSFHVGGDLFVLSWAVLVLGWGDHDASLEVIDSVDNVEPCKENFYSFVKLSIFFRFLFNFWGDLKMLTEPSSSCVLSIYHPILARENLHIIHFLN